MIDLTYEPYEHPPAPTMSVAERRAWLEPEPPRYEPTENQERMALQYEEQRAYDAAER